MVEKTTSEYKKKWVTERAIFYPEDVHKHKFTSEMAGEAIRWIKKHGYHYWGGDSGVGIRLEKNSYTIIHVQVNDITDYPNEPIYIFIDCICYAAMLLYRRLKRDGVIG